MGVRYKSFEDFEAKNPTLAKMFETCSGNSFVAQIRKKIDSGFPVTKKQLDVVHSIAESQDFFWVKDGPIGVKCIVYKVNVANCEFSCRSISGNTKGLLFKVKPVKPGLFDKIRDLAETEDAIQVIGDIVWVSEDRKYSVLEAEVCHKLVLDEDKNPVVDEDDFEEDGRLPAWITSPAGRPAAVKEILEEKAFEEAKKSEEVVTPEYTKKTKKILPSYSDWRSKI